MPGENIQFAVSGGTPGADANTYTLFDSTVCFGAPNQSNSKSTTLAAHDISRIEFSVKNSQAGTLNAQFSQDKGTTWTTYDTRAVAIAGANTISGPFDYLVDPFPDWRLQWVNGGVAQGTWLPALVGIRSFHGAGV